VYRPTGVFIVRTGIDGFGSPGSLSQVGISDCITNIWYSCKKEK